MAFNSVPWRRSVPLLRSSLPSVAFLHCLPSVPSFRSFRSVPSFRSFVAFLHCLPSVPFLLSVPLLRSFVAFVPFLRFRSFVAFGSFVRSFGSVPLLPSLSQPLASQFRSFLGRYFVPSVPFCSIPSVRFFVSFLR